LEKKKKKMFIWSNKEKEKRTIVLMYEA